MRQSAMEDTITRSKNPSVRLMTADLSSRGPIRKSVQDLKEEYGCLHILIDNAANFDMSLKGPVLTEDGVETIFAANHLGPFLMTKLLSGRLQSSGPARVIDIASKGLLFFLF